jgi:UDP-glucose 4-epimerase
MSGRVLITGASGFVGYHLIEEALHRGLEVYAAVRSSSKVDHLRTLPVKFTQPDFSNIKSLRADLEANQYDYIIHAAGVTKALHRKEYDLVNAEYTRNLGQAICETQLPLRKFVFISSLAAVGPSPNGHPITEHDPAKPVTPYGKSKLLAELYLSTLYALPVIILRPTAVYGPRDQDLFIVLKAISRGIEPYIGHKAQQLSFIYVKDLATATLDALESPVTRKAYNVSDGVPYNRYALADISKAILHKQTLRLHLPGVLVRTMAFIQETVGRMRGRMPALNLDKIPELTAANWSCSIDHIKQDLGFTPRYTFESGLAETIQWYKDNQWLK